ncbi:MAG TPA: hypothetical protein VGQ76_04395 [Thermoanaerobaculia bacterium]|nr:hypothetical protein [Thermoanaerobaculia bacterium]
MNYPIAQSRRLLATMMRKPRRSRILSLDCGDVPDFELIAPHLAEFAGEIWCIDSDSEALDHAALVLESIAGRCHIIGGNAVFLADCFPGNFDLVLGNRLVDHRETGHAIHLIRAIYHHQLRVGGTFFFTSTAREEDVLALCRKAGVPPDAVAIRTDESGVALLVDVER